MKDTIAFGFVTGVTIAVVLAVFVAANSHFGIIAFKSPF